MERKKRRIINYIKLARILSITLILMLTMVFTIKSTADGSTRDSFKEVVVCQGDTLWQIAGDYSQGENIEKVIYEIKKFNRMDSSDIFPGQKLKIPAHF